MKFLSFALILLSLTYHVQASLEDDLKRLEDDLAKLQEKRKKEADVTTTSQTDDTLSALFDESKVEDAAKSNDATALDDAATTTALKELHAAALLDSLAERDVSDPEMEKLIEMSIQDVLTKVTNGDLDEFDDDEFEVLDDAQEKKSLKFNCKDAHSKNCRFLLKRMTNACNIKNVQRMCMNSCKLCPVIPDCSKKPLGCCWDRSTAKTDQSGSNCPVCKDKYKTMCTTFKDHCKNPHTVAGGFMKKYCQETCDECGGKCEDDSGYVSMCSICKGLNWCNVPNTTKEKDLEKRRVMKLHCRKTCGFC